jgi:hypothetical protein
MDTIVMPNQIDLGKIKYGAVKTLPSGGKSIYVSNNGSPFIVQTPEMRSPFGLSKWDKKEKDANGVEKDSFKYDLLLGFDGKDTRDILATFYTKMSELDDKLISDGMEHSMNWLGKKMNSKEVVEELYTPHIRHSRDKNTGETNDKYPPTIKVSVPFRNGRFECDAYGPDKNEIKDLSAINLQGARITSIIQCVGIWVVGKKFGCTWKVIQMKINPKSNIPKFAFREDPEATEAADSDDEDDDLPIAGSSGNRKVITNNEVADSDEDDDDEDDDAADELNAKIPKLKV